MAYYTQSSEPILIPKVQIYFADFPYLHCFKTRGYSPWEPDAVVGTAMHTGINVPRFSWSITNARDTANAAVLCQAIYLIAD